MSETSSHDPAAGPVEHSPDTPDVRPAPQLLVGLVLGLTALLTLLLVAFSWPSSQLGPRDFPVAVVGPAELATQVDRALDQALGEGAVTIVPAASREQALSLVEEREVYGALVPGGQGVEVLIASASGQPRRNWSPRSGTGSSPAPPPPSPTWSRSRPETPGALSSAARPSRW